MAGEVEDRTEQTLGELGEFRNGANFSQDDYGPGFPIVNVKQLYRGRYASMDDLNELSAEAVSKPETLFLRYGDILFARSSVKASGAGQVAMVGPCKPNAVFSGFIIRFRVNATDRVASEYLNYLLRSPIYRELLTRIGSGTTITNLSQDTLAGLPIPLPPLAEQKAIAAVLGALDDRIELNRRMNATLEAMARALFQSWFVDFDPVRAKLDNRQPPNLDPTKAALFPNKFQDSPLGPIPHTWTVGTIDEATSLIIDYRGRTPKKLGSDWSITGIPAVSAKNVKGGRLVRSDMFNFVSHELYERWMKDKLALGDILMTSEAPLGELYYLALDARFCLSQRIFAMRADPARCESTFLYYWLESPSCQADIINRGTGTTVEGIRQSELRKVSVLLPPLPIQKAAAKSLAGWTDQIHSNEAQSRTLAAVRDTLLPKLLSGEVSFDRLSSSLAKGA